MLLGSLCSASAAATENSSTTSSSPSFSRNSASDNPRSTSSSASVESSSSLVSFPSLPSLSLSSSSSYYHMRANLLTSFYSKPSSSNNSAAVALALSSSSNLLYCAWETEISVYDIQALREVSTFTAPSGAGAAKSVAVLTDGRVLTAHQDRRVRVWKPDQNKTNSLQQHRLVATLPTTTDRFLRLPVPSNYVSVRRHHRLLWIEHADTVSGIAAHEKFLYSVSWDKTLKIWDSCTLRCIESMRAHDDAVNAVTVSPNGTVYTGSGDGCIRAWVLSSKRHTLVATLEKHKSAINALATSSDGTVLYSGAGDRAVIVWEREDSANHMVVVGALHGHTRAVLAIACVGMIVLTGSADRTVRVWRRGMNGKDYSCLGVLDGHSRGVRSLAALAVKPTDKVGDEEEEFRVCSGSLDGEVRVWQIQVASATKGSDSDNSQLAVNEQEVRF